MNALPQSESAEKFDWLEDEVHPRRTGYRRDGGRITQHPGIPTRVGAVVRLAEYVIVTEVDGNTIWFDPLIGDPICGDPDYFIVANREVEDEDAAPPR